MEYVWGVLGSTWTGQPEFVMLTRESAERVSEILGLFMECNTWGDLRREAPPDVYAEILGLAGYGDFAEYAAHLLIGNPVPGALEDAVASFDPDARPPDDDDVFDASSQIGAFGDGDYPPDPRYLMNLEIPADLIEEHGETYETIFNGVYARFPAEAAEAIVPAMEARGHTCTRDDILVGSTIRM